jgi:hypothetical protein
MNYDIYINSKGWIVKKNEFYAQHGYYCDRCGENRKGFLNIHHKHYKTLGNENVKRDLLALCKNCHAEYHATFGKEPDEFTSYKFMRWKNPKKLKIYEIETVKVVINKDKSKKLKSSLRFQRDRYELKLKKAMDLLKAQQS